jgi:hypothetical protein
MQVHNPVFAVHTFIDAFQAMIDLKLVTSLPVSDVTELVK